MLSRAESGLAPTIQSVRTLDRLVLEIIKQQPMADRERNIEVLDRARGSLSSVLPSEIAEVLNAETGSKRSTLVKRLRAISEIATALEDAASPAVFNPLDYRVLGRSIAGALDSSQSHVMPPASRFFGVGVYALYYIGEFQPYRPLVEKNTSSLTVPIYVGKAVPEGARIGGSATAKPALCDRLQLHAKSISEASSTLRLEDFRYRFLVVEPAFVPLGEVVLLKAHRPLWNSWLYGFGSNPAGRGRGKTRKSLWDTLHPGRVRAAGFGDVWNREELMGQVERYLRGEQVDQRLLRLAQEAEAEGEAAEDSATDLGTDVEESS